MLKKILPTEITYVIDARLNLSRIYELRFRADMPAVINYGGRYYYIGKNGITEDAKSALVVSADTVRGIVIKATEFSLYSVNNQLVKGYITISGGIRLGVSKYRCKIMLSSNV